MLALITMPTRVLNGVLALLACAAFSAGAQEAWKPSRQITLIVPNAAAGTSDRTARELQRILHAHKLVDVPVVVVNRPGGSGTLALNQLRASSGDGHVLLINNGAMQSAYVSGLTPYSHAEFTPIAIVVDEYFGINVQAGAALKSAADLLERLRRSPDALSFGTASLAGNNYLSMLMALRKGGIDVKRIRTVSFPGGAESTLALLGGHVDATSTGLGNMVEHLLAGKMRTLVMSGPQRMWGPFANVPTWRELGIDVVASGWRGVLGAQNLTAAQVAYWEALLRRVMQTPEWKQELHENYWVGVTLSAAETRRRLDAEYAEIRQIMSELGMVKGK